MPSPLELMVGIEPTTEGCSYGGQINARQGLWITLPKFRRHSSKFIRVKIDYSDFWQSTMFFIQIFILNYIRVTQIVQSFSCLIRQ